ncbi:hypothetical protein [Sphingobium sp. KCTC 72723]|uniref:hypothetical protein n=1 Tax=Sphingobium sp. KCTC 72723 TaxID=2733867 RepID=UPI00165E4265|nr:hypothetical protein [Sphingobium sp. KCTC 72723]
MSKPSYLTLHVLNALNCISTEIYVRTALRNSSPYVVSVARSIALDVRQLRLSLRHTDPYNAKIHHANHNMFTLKSAVAFVKSLSQK